MKYYSYDPVGGLKLHETGNEAQRAAQDALESRIDEWLEDTALSEIEWGELVPLEKASQTHHEPGLIVWDIVPKEK